MLGREPHVDVSGRPSLEARQLETISNSLVQHKHRTAPDMNVMELGLREPLLGEQIQRRQTRFQLGHDVLNEDSKLNSHWPQLRISNIRPVDCSMKKEGSGTGHGVLDALLSHCIVMMTTSSSKLGQLLELGQSLGESLAGETGMLIQPEGLRDNTMVAAHCLELLKCFKSCMCVQGRQEFNMDKARSCVHKDATTLSELGIMGLSTTRAQPAKG